MVSEVGGYDTGTLTRTVDVHIASLRNKLEHNPSHPEMDLDGIGTRLQIPGASAYLAPLTRGCCLWKFSPIWLWNQGVVLGCAAVPGVVTVMFCQSGSCKFQPPPRAL